LTDHLHSVALFLSHSQNAKAKVSGSTTLVVKKETFMPPSWDERKLTFPGLWHLFVCESVEDQNGLDAMVEEEDVRTAEPFAVVTHNMNRWVHTVWSGLRTNSQVKSSTQTHRQSFSILSVTHTVRWQKAAWLANWLACDFFSI